MPINIFVDPDSNLADIQGLHFDARRCRFVDLADAEHTFDLVNAAFESVPGRLP